MSKPLPKHIIIGTDFSDASRHAVAAADRLALRFGARVSLLHVYDAAPLGPDVSYPARVWTGGDFEQVTREHCEKLLDDARRRQLGGVSDVTCRAISHPSAADAICDYAEENAGDLVVIGTHGRSGMDRLLLGSVAERVVRHAPASVLVARQRDHLPKKILVGTDFSEGAKAAVRHAAAVAPELDADVTLLHAYDIDMVGFPPGFGFYRKLDDVDGQLRDALASAYTESFSTPPSVALIAGASPAHSMATYAKRHGFDMIVVATHGRTGLTRLLVGSVAEKLARLAHCSVCIVRRDEDTQKEGQ